MWKNNANTSGFKLIYSAYPPSEFSGWPDVPLMFGFTDQTSEYQEITLNSDLIQLEICVDGNASNTNHDFEGFKF